MVSNSLASSLRVRKMFTYTITVMLEKNIQINKTQEKSNIV
jgi:hypothetical protein